MIKCPNGCDPITWGRFPESYDFETHRMRHRFECDWCGFKGLYLNEEAEVIIGE